MNNRFLKNKNSENRQFREIEYFGKSWMYFSEKSRIWKIVNFGKSWISKEVVHFRNWKEKCENLCHFSRWKFWWFNHNSRKCYSCLFQNEKFKNPSSRKWTWSPIFDQTTKTKKFFKNQIQRFEVSQKNLVWNLKKLKRDEWW